jgi:large subunit ribosomal protein L23
MGLFDNWLKKKKKEQLQKTSERARPVSVKEKKEEKEPAHEHVHEHNETEQSKGKKHSLPLHSEAHRILLRPLVTEKSAIAESENKYSFVVARWANKNQVMQAVKDVYRIEPESVNIMNIDGRQVRFGRNMGRRSDYKKAIVTLPKGKTIDIHTGV